MNILKGALLNSEHLSRFYSDLNTSVNELSSYVTGIYNGANELYNYSSALEDILTIHISSFYNQLNSITYSYTNSTVIFLESFKSTEYVDKKFVVDNQLNIDTNNQTLTLPIKGSEKLTITSAIIEPDSDGSAGNSLQNFSNSKIESIFDNDISSIFEYEKYSNAFENSSLKLVLTLKLSEVSITNGLYIKLFSSSNTSYATLESIEVSKDSALWYNINDFIDSGSITKNDHYVRYTSVRTGFIRLIFKQSTAEMINTDFGIKNRYSIGIRNIEVYKNEFDKSGDYISIPFNTGKPIKKVSLSSELISNDDVFFYISANNGGKWISITPNSGTSIDLLTIDTGVMIPNNLRTIRVRINVVRKASQDVNYTSQTFPIVYGSMYTLKYLPIKLNAVLGGHISYGDMVKYNISMPPPFNILNDLYLNSGYKIITKENTNIFNIYNNSHSTDEDKIGQGATFNEALAIVDNSILRSIGRNYIQTIRYVPYTNTINDDLEIMSGSEIIDRWSSTTNNGITTYWIISRILPHPTSMHSYIFLDLDNLCQFYKVNDETDVVTNINLGGIPETTTTTTTTTTTIKHEKTIYLMYCEYFTHEHRFYFGLKIDGSKQMNGSFSSTGDGGGYGDFASDSRIEFINSDDFRNKFGDPAHCDDSNSDQIIAKITFSSKIEFGMFIDSYGFSSQELEATVYYVENVKSWPPYPWDNGPRNGKHFIIDQTKFMDDPVVINASDVSNDDIYNIGMYTYPI